MALATQETTIGGKTFTVTQLPAMRSLRLSARLMKLAGPSLLAAAMAGGMNADAMSALSPFFDRLTEDEFEGLTRALLDGCTVELEGKRVEVMRVFDSIFQGRLEDVFVLLKFSLMVNYGESFSALAGAAVGARVQAAPESA